jgi:hypothetical protein
VLGTLNAFFLAFVVVIVRHVKPTANETMMKLSTPEDSSAMTASTVHLSKRKTFNWLQH